MTTRTRSTQRQLDAITQERIRQEGLALDGTLPCTCADDYLTHEQRLAVLAEEVGEVAREISDAIIEGRGVRLDHMHAELIQVAAVAVAWCEAIDGGAA